MRELTGNELMELPSRGKIKGGSYAKKSNEIRELGFKVIYCLTTLLVGGAIHRCYCISSGRPTLGWEVLPQTPLSQLIVTK